MPVVPFGATNQKTARKDGTNGSAAVVAGIFLIVTNCFEKNVGVLGKIGRGSAVLHAKGALLPSTILPSTPSIGMVPAEEAPGLPAGFGPVAQGPAAERQGAPGGGRDNSRADRPAAPDASASTGPSPAVRTRKAHGSPGPSGWSGPSPGSTDSQRRQRLPRERGSRCGGGTLPIGRNASRPSRRLSASDHPRCQGPRPPAAGWYPPEVLPPPPLADGGDRLVR